MYKKIVEGKKAALFDLDGTIVDTEIYWTQAFENALKKINLDWFDQEELPSGLTIADKVKYVINKYHDYLDGKPNTKELIKDTYDNFLDIIKNADLDVKNGFWDTAYELKELKKFKLGLVTNTPKNVTDAILEKLNIHYTFDVIVTGDEVKRGKPFPDLYLKAAEKLKMKPGEIVAFEDSIIGADAVFAAKMSLVVIWSGEPNQLQYPETVLYFLPDFTALPGNLDKNYDEALKSFAENIIQEKAEEKEEEKDTTPIA